MSIADDHNALIEIVLDYLRGHKIQDIKSRLKIQVDTHVVAAKHCYEQIPNQNIHSILDELVVANHPLRTEAAKKPHLYAALKMLSVQHPHLRFLLDLIDETKPVRNWLIYFQVAAGFIAGLSLFIYLKENVALIRAWYERVLPIAVHWLNNTRHLLLTMPVFGVLCDGIFLAHAWYQAIADGFNFNLKKFITLMFKTAEHGLPFLGYALCFLTAGVMTLPSLALIITGSVMHVVETLYTLIQDEIARINTPLAQGADYLSQKANICADNIHARGRFVFMVNFIATALLATAIIIWCVFPPSLFVAAACFVFSRIVDAIRHTILSRTEKENAEALQSEVASLYKQKQEPPTQTAEPEPTPALRPASKTTPQALKPQTSLEYSCWGFFRFCPTDRTPNNEPNNSERPINA